jgi:hypothetical protein
MRALTLIAAATAALAAAACKSDTPSVASAATPPPNAYFIGPQPGPSLRDSSWYYGGDEASIFASIAEGRQHGMPAWGSKLPESDIWKIVTYIKSLRTPDEPDAPH